MARETILIVDDSSEITSVLRDQVLTPQGYQVISAVDGRRGLDMAVTHKPDLIMLDMMMPRMTGMEMLTALRRTECQAPVIFMTMHGSESIAVAAFRLGVRDYLTKPFTAEEAQQAVDRALSETRLAREKEELARNLIAAETVQQTMVTLSHYINNYLMVVEGGLTLLREGLQAKSPDHSNLLRIAQDSLANAAKIAAVMRVLKRVTAIKEIAYHGETRMIDIEAALHEELTRRQ